jgi:hypothetical protein
LLGIVIGLEIVAEIQGSTKVTVNGISEINAPPIILVA